MSDYVYRSRLSVEIDQKIKNKLDKLIRWGQLRHVVEAILLDLIDKLDGLEPEDREMALAAIIGRKFRPRDFIKSLE